MKAFGEIFIDKTKYGVKVQTSEYSELGEHIIIDQGQSQIAGYTDREEGLFEEVPVIVFGDHTRIIKYVDKPFFLGADGVKVLRSKDENANYKYLYYALKNAKIPNTGYNRHFKWLKNIQINYPAVEKQAEIVAILDKVSSVIRKREDELSVLDDLIKARFVEMFGSIHDGRFDMKTLPEIVKDDKNSIKRGPFGGALKKDDFVEEGYLVYEQRHAIHNDFEYAKYYITQEKYEDMIGFKVIPGDLIISCSGVTLGRIAEVPEDAKEGIINQALLKLSLNPHIMKNTFFIQQFRGEEIQDILFGFSRGSGIPNMPSMSEVKAVKFICPPLELQKEYCSFVRQTDKSKVAVQKALDETQMLFDSLMQEYFG